MRHANPADRTYPKGASSRLASTRRETITCLRIDSNEVPRRNSLSMNSPLPYPPIAIVTTGKVSAGPTLSSGTLSTSAKYVGPHDIKV
mmetsp:Transcript_103094/g.182681  ORF Transcript_103094/g.182681 Transcript_103094/m.182681 type:complete len:88 (-) Transcript_103094:582-845(-)